MTTIAANRKGMSADRKVTDGGYSTTKIQVIGESIFGAAGLVIATNKFFSWIKAGKPFDGAPDLSEDKDTPFVALELNRKGIFIYLDACEPDKVREREMAVGSGGDVARYAMRVRGFSPENAVREASKEDDNTGNQVDTILLSSVPKAKG